ncbi:MAG: T9SS type A sorting domain-containing protein [Bacteroidota bacterium]
MVGEEAFKIKFETVNDFGNNLYLDNINLEASCVVIWDEPADSSDVPFTFTLYPNPGSDLFYLRIFPEEQAELSLQLFDTRGRDVYRETVGLVGEPSEHEMDFSSISRGIYFLRMKLGDAYRTTKLVIR